MPDMLSSAANPTLAAAAITLAPLRAAHTLGYRIGVLESSPMGVGLYTSLGFRVRCSFEVYRWDP